MTLPDTVLAFYGDDFTGSTDAMEVTALAGLRTVLFTRVPTAAELARFGDARVVGIAGVARAQSPAWMEANLPAAFASLAALGAPLLQYKVCSTFDSARHVGSIGKAIDIGMQVAGGAWSPCIVGAPQLRRWLAFANLFAGVGDTRYRIDRHPTMSRHPVTPMGEADLTLHLARQTGRPIVSIDLAEMFRGNPDAAVARAAAEGAVALIDVVDGATQEAAGGLVWRHRGDGLFSASSSGLQYALVSHFRAASLMSHADPFAPAPAVRRVLVLSGSCSPGTAEQIAVAEAAGFALVRLDVLAVAEAASAAAEVERVVAAVDCAFARQAGVVVYAARTVDDPAFAALASHCAARDIPFAEAQAGIGAALARIAQASIRADRPDRVVVAGGDTSGRIVAALQVAALEVKHRFHTGAPVCRCHSGDGAFDGLEIVLKGGQLGGPRLFVEALAGV
jgi:uncharacterized protein YgbK (DUF1537 family)